MGHAPNIAPLSSSKVLIVTELMKLLGPYKERVEKEISLLIPTLGEKTPLRNACEYALLTEGKRFRPAIVLMIADALQVNHHVMQPALAVEFFHTASLIADDLPCMDNDDLRRGKPTVHKAFDEAIALLASFALIALSFEYLASGAAELKGNPKLASQSGDICRIATVEAGKLNGILGLIGGQYLDLYPVDIDEKLIMEIIKKKTVVLFELSFILGWLFGGGDMGRIEDVKKASFHFGTAFQILDDIDDFEQDLKAGKRINYAVFFGLDAAKKAVKEHTHQFLDKLNLLQLHSRDLERLGEILQKMCE